MDEANDMSQFWGRLLREDDTNNSTLVDQLLQQYQEEQTLQLNLNSHSLSKPLNSIDSSLLSPASVDVAGLDEDLARRYANLKKTDGTNKKSEGIHKGSHENSGKVQKNHENPLNTYKNSGNFEDTNKKPGNFNDALKNSEGTHKNLGKFEDTLNKFQDTLEKTEGTPENSGKIQKTHENSLNFKDDHENALNFNVTNESFKNTLGEKKGEKIRDAHGKFVPVDEEELQILGSELASRFAALKANSFKGLENPTITLESKAGNSNSEVQTSLFERGAQNPNLGNDNEDEVKRLLASVQDAMRLVQDKVSGSSPRVAFDDETERDGDSEVEKIVEWAKDAARLDPNLEEVGSDGEFEDDDDDTSDEDESSVNHKKKKLSSRSRKEDK